MKSFVLGIIIAGAFGLLYGFAFGYAFAKDTTNTNMITNSDLELVLDEE